VTAIKPAFEPAPFTGRILVARGGSDATPALFLADADSDGRHWVRQLTEDELATLAQQATDALADRTSSVPVDLSAARVRERDLPAARAARQAAAQ
jgi:hypothetical protein